MLSLIVGKTIVTPIDEVVVNREMKRVPSSIEFKVLKEQVSDIKLGDKITATYDDGNLFMGYVFCIKENKDDVVSIKGYDQMRYLKNQHTMLIKNKTATKLIKEIASEFKLQVGEMEDTKVDIATKQKIVENKSLIDIIYDALEDTMLANNQKGNRTVEYLLYDDFGKLTLKKLKDMKSKIILTEENTYNYSFSRDIDNSTYTKIYIYYKDDKEHKINKHIVNDTDTQKKWGILQKTISTKRITKQQAEEYAKKLLKYYGVPKQSFTLDCLVGDINIRGGTSVAIMFNTTTKNFNNFFVVNKVKHVFKDNEYTMKLELLGVDMA